MGHNERQVVGVIYRHPNIDILRFQKNLENLLRELNNKKLNYYICGDINIDLLQINKRSSIKGYSDMLYSMGCVPLITCPTCY